MKKLVLTSLLAVFAVSGAHAAGTLDNPLYRPDKGMFYSMTELSSDTNSTTRVDLDEEFGYGITDRLAVGAAVSMAENNWFDQSQWGTLGIGVNYRLLNMENWKADVYGSYGVNPVWDYGHSFMDEDLTWYNWNVGMRAGYVTDAWTVAGHVDFDYSNSESFNWGDDGWHTLSLGMDILVAMNEDWNLAVGAEYTGIMDDRVENAGQWEGKIGANYHIDDNMFVGFYLSKYMAHRNPGQWTVADGFGYGAKFGIQF